MKFKSFLFLLIIFLSALCYKLFLVKDIQAENIPEPIYTQDCFPRTLKNNGVTQKCFEKANFGQNEFCSDSEIKTIKEYYKEGQDKDPLNDGSGRFCAD